ncbi:MAG TPA: MFS transporter [Dehalococcoidia bacterium]|nr:MFS transporter [Dehalococcoidia bacterium]
MSVSATVEQAQSIVARIERIPFSTWHTSIRLIVGIATFFDAIDALTIAYVMPVLIPLFKIPPARIGGLIAIGYVGQLIGAIFFGWLAEKIGRRDSLLASVALYTVMSFACAASNSYAMLFSFRTVQGLGLGGEVPIAAAYISELSKAKGRGRFVLLYEMLFAIGLLVAALLGYWIVPRLGWRWMFMIGGLPAILALCLRWIVPESPRWLINKGRLEEADKIVTYIERKVSQNGKIPLPPVEVALQVPQKKTQWRELFQGIYLKRTLVLWCIWFCAYFCNYGLVTWLPSLYTQVYKLPLKQGLQYSLINQAAALALAFVCALLIDKVGRKAWFLMSFVCGGIFLLALFFTGAGTATLLLTLGALGNMFVASIAMALYVYSPEVYPTRMRALGSSTGTVWLRLASILGPIIVGFIVAGTNIKWAFLMFGVVSLIGAVIVGLFAIETKGRPLEELSP